MAVLKGMIDLDYVKYAAAAKGEDRTIKVIHKVTGDEMAFKTRTELWGRKKARNEGWIGEQLAKGIEVCSDDYIVEDVQTPAKDMETAYKIADSMVAKGLRGAGVSSYKAFLGAGDSFRVERSTILKYKGQRGALIKPLALAPITEYLRKKFKATVVTDIENDDRVVMECYKKPNNVIIGVDKDFYGSPARFYNPNKPDEGIIDCDCFGKLWEDDKGDVRGYGRLFLYYQICANDRSDNYAANCASEQEWGSKSSYNSLVNCKTEKEAWTAMDSVFKMLYPEPKIITGWRGDEIKIDADYVFNEVFDMARMLRFDGDKVVATDIRNKLLGVQ